MNVKNRKCIRHLSYKTMMASKRRNIIAIAAIGLTTLMFTALFTVVLSLNVSYQNFVLRQTGGYSHGSFKEVNEEDIEKIKGHKMIKESGVRTNIGVIGDIPFNKETAEVSYMDDNCTKWNYALPSEGRMPEKTDEISMDRRTLELLGAEGIIGEKINLSYDLCDIDSECQKITDSFTLVGIFEYDNLLPVHYINISKEYADNMRDLLAESGEQDFRTDLYVMFSNSLDISYKMQKVYDDLDIPDMRPGVNWAYIGSDFSPDIETTVAAITFLILVIFTGYLIIYNIFQISVTGDIRFYGLLKTIGVTPDQLKRIIRNQALMLCAPGIPLGFLAGYGVGAGILPAVMNSTNLKGSEAKLSTSPVIFLAAAVLSLITVLISCRKPGKVASGISPVEAVKFTDTVKKTTRKSRSVSGFKMALSNLGRNRKKTIIVIVSLSLSLVLLNILFAVVNGFDEEKYLENNNCCDFIVSSSEYFRYDYERVNFSEEMAENIKENVNPEIFGCAYMTTGPVQTWMEEAGWLSESEAWKGRIFPPADITLQERKEGRVKEFTWVEGLDSDITDKLTVLEGSLDPLKEAGGKYIAIVISEAHESDNFERENYPEIGGTITVEYSDVILPVDYRTGEEADETTPPEFIRLSSENTNEVEYTVCAYVRVPYTIGFRSLRFGYYMVLNKDTFMEDSVSEVVPMLAAFDTADENAEAQAEAYLSETTSGITNSLMYESRETQRAELREFKKMFLIVGGALCIIIGLVGILNFFNTFMTDIMSRAKEFAVLQSIGMTGKQLKQMLITEGIMYAGGSALFALVLSLILNPVEIAAINSLLWICSAKFTIMPVVIAFPVFVVIALTVSVLLYNKMKKMSIVERIRDIGQ